MSYLRVCSLFIVYSYIHITQLFTHHSLTTHSDMHFTHSLSFFSQDSTATDDSQLHRLPGDCQIREGRGLQFPRYEDQLHTSLYT